MHFRNWGISYVATGEVTTLEHELGDDAVEGGALVAEAGLASAELTKISGGLGDDAVVELESDAALLDYRHRVLERSFIQERRGAEVSCHDENFCAGRGKSKAYMVMTKESQLRRKVVEMQC